MNRAALALTALALSAAAGVAADALDAARKAEADRIAAIEKVRPAVVAVFDPDTVGQGGGSGVLIDADGFALTNYHVVAAGDKPVGFNPVLKCGLPDGQLYDAVTVGLDRVGDVALIKLLPKAEGRPFPFAPMGDSDTVKVGDWSLAMGNPFLLATDFTPTITFGLVSGTRRYQYPSGTLLEYTDCIQIDTSINPGNSGGPLFNLKGEIIGINGRGSFDKRGRVNSGVGYAISINQIKNFLGAMRAGMDTDHATLGAGVQTEVADGEVNRVTVKGILEDSDAARRGLDIGDELVSFAGRPVRTVNGYKNALGVYPKDWRLPLVFRRENDKREVLVRLMPLQAGEAEAGRRPPKQPRPDMPQPKKKKADRPPSPALKLYKEKPGFTNFYFNELEQAKLLSGFRKHGDFSGLAGEWLMEGDAQLRQREGKAWARLVDTKTPDGKPGTTLVKLNLGVEYDLDPLKGDQDVRDFQNPPGSGGFMLALYQYRRFLTTGPKGFEGGVSHAGLEPFYPPPADGSKPAKPADARVMAEVLRTEHAAVAAKWYFSPEDQTLLGFEVFPVKDGDPCEVYLSDYRPVDGRKLPHRVEVRHGDERFGAFAVRGWRLGAS